MEKQQLSAATGLTYDQVQHWFINARMRKCKPRMAQRANSAITVAAQIAANDNKCASDSPKKMKRERSDGAAQTATWAIQEDEASWWSDASIAYFQSLSHRPLPDGVAAPAHDLDYYRAIRTPHAPGDTE